MQSVQSLIEQAQSDFPEVGVWAGFLEELERTADSKFEWHHCMNQVVCYASPVSLFSVEAFKKRFRNVKEVTEFSTLLEHIMKGVVSYTACVHEWMHLLISRDADLHLCMHFL